MKLIHDKLHLFHIVHIRIVYFSPIKFFDDSNLILNLISNKLMEDTIQKRGVQFLLSEDDTISVRLTEKGVYMRKLTNCINSKLQKHM